MAWEDFLNHRCDIFHLINAGDTGAFGIRADAHLVPEETPIETDVHCHFHIKQNNLT